MTNIKNSKIKKLIMTGVYGYGFGGFNKKIKYKEELTNACIESEILFHK